jgi:16S rRNA (guanine527-N7)-methyltransferase
MGDQEVEIGRQSAKLRTQLLTGAKASGVELDEQAADKLLAYIALLAKWNRTYNLTAIDEPQRMVSHHLLDCLAIVPYVHGNRVLDIGSGAGLPGIPLAIVLPEKSFVLLDSNSKKTRFLVQAAAELKLGNVEVVNSRVEQYTTGNLFNTITARAFSSMGQMLEQSAHLCAADGRYLFMKGREPVQEIAEIGPKFRVTDTHLLDVPGIDGQRRLVIVEPVQEVFFSDVR